MAFVIVTATRFAQGEKCSILSELTVIGDGAMRIPTCDWRTKMGWTPDKLPDLKGKCYAITGGNSGLGLELCKILAGCGARVVITSRSPDKGEAAMNVVRDLHPEADLAMVQLDLSDLANVDRAAEELIQACPSLDAMVNNAGIMQTPALKTKDGFELQFGTNHLGHFRLNAKMFKHLDACGARIVPVSSIAHRFGQFFFDDPMFESRRYDPIVAYGQSKLANIVYGFELQRRLSERGSQCIAIPCHPGYAATNLQSTGVGLDGGSWVFRSLYAVTNRMVAQSATKGAYPLALAAADPEAEAGAYYGPCGPGQAWGPVGKSRVAKQAQDPDAAQKLWALSEELVGPFFT